MTSTFIDLPMILKNSNNEKPSSAYGLFYENCVLHILFRQINVYIHGILASTNTNLSHYTSYIQFMLMTPMFYKLLRGIAIRYEYKVDTETSNNLEDATT